MVCLWLVKYSNLCRIIFNTKCSETVLQLGIIWSFGWLEGSKNKATAASTVAFGILQKRATSAISPNRKQPRGSV